MKKSVIALAIAGALAPVLAQAQSNVTLYGRIDTSFERQKLEGASAGWAMLNNASRLGVKGSEDLGNGLNAVFGIETALNSDSGSSGLGGQLRNSYVGLTSKSFGSFVFGRVDSGAPTGSPLYSQLTKAFTIVARDAGSTGFLSDIFNHNNRVSNSFNYKTPTFGGFNVAARYNQFGTNDGQTTVGAKESDRKDYQLGGNYERGGLNVGLGYKHQTRTGGLIADDLKHGWQATGGYDFGFINPYAGFGRDTYQTPTASNRKNVDFWALGVTVPFAGSHAITTNYGQREVQTSSTGKLKIFQIGYDYKLSKRTTSYVLYDKRDPNSSASNDKITSFGVGVRHNF